MTNPLVGPHWNECWSLVVATFVGFSFLVWNPLAVLLVPVGTRTVPPTRVALAAAAAVLPALALGLVLLAAATSPRVWARFAPPPSRPARSSRLTLRTAARRS